MLGEGPPLSFSLWAAACILDLISPVDAENFTKAKQRFVHKTRAANFALEVGLKGSICPAPIDFQWKLCA